MSETRQILEERGKRHGPFRDHANITQAIKDVMTGIAYSSMGPREVVTNWRMLSHAQREALEMIAHKIGRILNGDPNYDDSWKDIAGYAQLVVDILNGKNT